MIEIFLLMALANNPSCKAEESEFMQWGNHGQGIVSTYAVPNGRIWLVRAAGVFGTSLAANYMLQIDRPVKSQGNACCWLIPIARSPGDINGTPYLALERPLILHAGEKLSSRVNGLTSSEQIGINMLYYSLPASCLPIG
jgi:hypothetical protein